MDLILGHEIDLVIDIPAQGAERSHDGFIIRRNAIETGVTVLTAVDTARALVTSMENRAKELYTDQYCLKSDIGKIEEQPVSRWSEMGCFYVAPAAYAGNLKNTHRILVTSVMS